MIRLVLFDIDGTLVHTGGAGIKAFAKVFASEFNIPNGTEKIRFAGRTDYSLVREFFVENRIETSAANFERFFDRYVFWLDQILAHSSTRECPGIRQFIGGLKQLPQSPVVGLLTGNVRLGAEIKLRHFDLWREFETGAFADDHEDRDEIARVAFARGRRLLRDHLRGEEVVVVGDTTLDIRCARAIGAKALAVATGGHKPEELRAASPDWLVNDLSEIEAGAVVRG